MKKDTIKHYFVDFLRVISAALEWILYPLLFSALIYCIFFFAGCCEKITVTADFFSTFFWFAVIVKASFKIINAIIKENFSKYLGIGLIIDIIVSYIVVSEVSIIIDKIIIANNTSEILTNFFFLILGIYIVPKVYILIVETINKRIVKRELFIKAFLEAEKIDNDSLPREDEIQWDFSERFEKRKGQIINFDTKE